MEYVHANEVILTVGRSHTTALFLGKAAEKRQFQVIVAEGAPSFEGLPMARQLAEAGIQATVITDAAVYVGVVVITDDCALVIPCHHPWCLSLSLFVSSTHRIHTSHSQTLTHKHSHTLIHTQTQVCTDGKGKQGHHGCIRVACKWWGVGIGRSTCSSTGGTSTCRCVGVISRGLFDGDGVCLEEYTDREYKMHSNMLDALQ